MSGGWLGGYLRTDITKTCVQKILGYVPILDSRLSNQVDVVGVGRGDYMVLL